MAQKRRRKRQDRTAQEPERQSSAFGRNAKIWLATLSAVIGVATGMFTLRDQVFPGEAGSAPAASGPVYEQAVGRVCDKLNDLDERRAQADATIRRKLKHAKTTIAQRNALLDGVQQTAARSGDALAAFTGLEAPHALSGTRRETEAAWNRNLARLRGYALRLDHAGTRAELVKAIDHLSSLRPVLAADGIKVRSGLERLGAANCDLQPPRVTATFTLPPARVHRPAQEHHGGGTPTAADEPASNASTPSAGAPAPTGSGHTGPTEGTPGVNTPDGAGPRANEPDGPSANTPHLRPPPDTPSGNGSGESGSANSVNTPSGGGGGGGGEGGAGG